MTNPKRKQNSREALLIAAAELFLERGYEAVSTREITDRAGVNLGAIQYHFGSKASLFLETVRSMMESSSCGGAGWFVPAERLETREAALLDLVRFVGSFLGYLLQKQEINPSPCRLMFREIFSGSTQDQEVYQAIVTSVVKDFVSPVNDALLNILRVISPELTPLDLDQAARSILGQCSYYVTHRPFIERMSNQNFGEPPMFESTVRHVCTFSLRALGCSSAEIADSVSKLSLKDSYQGCLSTQD